MIEKISTQPDCLCAASWANGKYEYIVDLENNCCFRFIEREKYPYPDQQKAQPIIACGFVGWLLKHKGNIASGNYLLDCFKEKQTKLNSVDSTQIYDGYLKSRLEMYRKEHKGDLDFKRDLERDFYFIHKAQEMLLVKKSEALYDFLPERDVELIKEYVRYYFKYVDNLIREKRKSFWKGFPISDITISMAAKVIWHFVSKSIK
jgi:hypothetical protein